MNVMNEETISLHSQKYNSFSLFLENVWSWLSVYVRERERERERDEGKTEDSEDMDSAVLTLDL